MNRRMSSRIRNPWRQKLAAAILLLGMALAGLSLGGIGQSVRAYDAIPTPMLASQGNGNGSGGGGG